MEKGNVNVSLPKSFANIIDEIIEKNPDFKNRVNVIRLAVRNYYDKLKELKEV